MAEVELDEGLGARFEGLVTTLAERGWAVVPDFLSAEEGATLARESRTLWQAGCFRRAGVGKGAGLQVRPEIRRDHVMWLDPELASTAQCLYLDTLEQLRRAINSALCLGLFEFEGHLALYPPGAFYRKHLDQFRGVEARTVTAVLYLNREWRPEDGGALRFYLDGDREDLFFDVQPQCGTLVCFLSGRFQHEVLPAARERLSITGWFRRRE